jgi:hypothetical protein
MRPPRSEFGQNILFDLYHGPDNGLITDLGEKRKESQPQEKNKDKLFDRPFQRPGRGRNVPMEVPFMKNREGILIYLRGR